MRNAPARVGQITRSLRFEVPLYERLERIAAERGESINACVVQAVLSWTEKQEDRSN